MRTIRILSLDGGGIRGIFSATFLERFCRDARIDGSKLWQYFDIIAGTSIGGIQSLAYSNGISPTGMLDLLKSNAEKIFTIRLFPYSLGPAGKTTLAEVLGTPGINCYIYDPGPLQDALKQVLGDTKMFQLKGNALITSVEFKGGTIDDGINFPYGDVTNVRYVRFSKTLVKNFTEGQNYKCVDVGVATGSAPVFFRPAQIGGAPNGAWYLDGGLYQNNPTALAYTFSNILFQENVKLCVLSVGTGYEMPNFEASLSGEEQQVRIAPQNGLNLLGSVTGITLSGAQEAVNEQFKIMSFYNGPTSNFFYYRFQTFLADKSLSQLDNPTPKAIAYLQASANAQYNKDALKIQLFIQKLQG